MVSKENGIYQLHYVTIIPKLTILAIGKFEGFNKKDIHFQTGTQRFRRCCPRPPNLNTQNLTISLHYVEEDGYSKQIN